VSHPKPFAGGRKKEEFKKHAHPQIDAYIGKRSQAFRQKTKQLINQMEGGVTCDNGDENSEDWDP
jgi:hypothetical protein